MTTDIDALALNNEVRKAFYKGDYPAASWMQVTRLLMPAALVEVEVIAHLPKK
jgi:enamine deaminase RidA (YjgF/YER057c/UK114 family)